MKCSHGVPYECKCEMCYKEAMERNLVQQLSAAQLARMTHINITGPIPELPAKPEPESK